MPQRQVRMSLLNQPNPWSPTPTNLQRRHATNCDKCGNTGPTYGLLPVLVLADEENRHIRHLLAPSYTYNSLFGQTGTMRYYWYPTDESQFVTIGSYSQHTNREIKVRYENTSLLDGGMYF